MNPFAHINLTCRVGSWILPCLLASCLLVLLVVTGANVQESLVLTGVVVLQSMTGAALWSLVRSERSVPMTELVGMGIALGTLTALLADQLLRGTILTHIAWFAPMPPAAIAIFLRARIRRPVSRLVPTTRAEVAAVALAVAAGVVALIPFWASHPLRWDGWWRYHPDIPFHEAFAHSLYRFGPAENILAVGQEIRYHWFAHAWAGFLMDVSGAAPFVVITRVVPLVATIGSVCLAWAWARRLSTVAWVPGLAALLVVASGYLGIRIASGHHVMPLSPSQAFSTPWLLALSFVLLEYLSARLRHRALIVLALLAVACVGGKVTHAAVVAGGVGLLTLSQGRQLRPPHRTLLAASVIAIGTGAAFLALINGHEGNGLSFGFARTASSVYGLEPLSGPLGVLLGGLALILAIIPRWAGLFCLLARRDSRLRPEVVYASGVAISGLLGTLLLSQAGASQLYFVLSASAVVSVVSAHGLGLMLTSTVEGKPLGNSRRHPSATSWQILLLAMALGTLTAISASALHFIGLRAGPLVRWAAPGLGWAVALAAVFALSLLITNYSPRVVPPLFAATLVASAIASFAGGTLFHLIFPPSPAAPEAPLAWTSQHAEAAAWLAEESHSLDIVATNRLCSEASGQPENCQSRWFLTSALTGRRMLMEGYDYAVGLGPLPHWALERVRLSVRMGERPTAETARQLWELGVRWMWIDPAVTANRSWSPYATVVYSNDAAIVLRLREPRSNEH